MEFLFSLIRLEICQTFTQTYVRKKILKELMILLKRFLLCGKNKSLNLHRHPILYLSFHNRERKEERKKLWPPSLPPFPFLFFSSSSSSHTFPPPYPKGREYDQVWNSESFLAFVTKSFLCLTFLSVL